MEESKFWDKFQELLHSKKATEIQCWIADLGFDKVWLRIKKTQDLEAEFICKQLQIRTKYKTKFPSLSSMSSPWIFPAGLPLEQSSSETAALYKANLLGGNRFIDLTGGMGIDAFFIGKKFQEIHYFELNLELLQLAEFNFSKFDNKAKFYLSNSEEFHSIIENLEAKDWVYLDPARRVQSKKVFLLHETQPNAIDIFEKCKQLNCNMMLKTSPMLDISLALRQLGFINEIHIVSIKNEIKELLFIKNQSSDNLKIKCIELMDSKSLIAEFHKSDNLFDINYGDWGTFAYEPHVTIIKANFISKFCMDFQLTTIHKDIKLYTSNIWVDSFPGKIFKIQKIVKPGTLDKTTDGFHILAKNYPETSEQVRTKFKIKSGKSNQYIILTKNRNQKPIWIYAERLQ